jgi:glutathione S-transferase
MNKPVTVIGSYPSPYVRKVLAVLHLKNVDYRIDPIVPFMGGDEFSRLSPLRRIPVLITDTLTLCDSTVICEYLEDRYPEPALYPRDAEQRARARWLEEYADTRIGDVFVWQYFNQLVIGRFIFGRKPDDEIVQRASTREIPQVLDYLEGAVPAEGFLFGSLGVADISVAAFFRNLFFARYNLDAARWPRVAAYVERVLAQPCLAQLRPFEELCLRTPPAAQRAALLAAGAPLTDQTLGTDAPRAGLMRI